jgi:DNA-binding transcriptional LysR family regulator
MHLTQQAERWLGGWRVVGRPLVCRQNQRIELTPDGEVILLAARRWWISPIVSATSFPTTLDGFVRFGFTQGFSLPMLFALQRAAPCPAAPGSALRDRRTSQLPPLEAGGLDVVLGAQADGNAQAK